MFGNVTDLEGLDVTGKYRNKSIQHTSTLVGAAGRERREKWCLGRWEGEWWEKRSVGARESGDKSYVLMTCVTLHSHVHYL